MQSMRTLPVMYGVEQGCKRSKYQSEMLVNYRLSVCEETENKDRELDIKCSVKYEVQEEITACTFRSLCDEKKVIYTCRVHQKLLCKYATRDKIVSFRELTRQAM